MLQPMFVYAAASYSRFVDAIFCSVMSSRFKEELLLASDALRSRFGDAIPKALDLEMASQIIGLSKRDGLPKVVRSVATSVSCSKFYSQPNSLSQSSTSTADLVSQVQDVMQEIQQQNQELCQVVAELARSLRGGTGSDLRAHVDEHDDLGD
ncbi:hypothetical protein QQ045_000104 [Rhodiola kirilowii]